MSHRITITMGLITSTLGLIGLGFAVFGPATFSYGINWLTAASTCLWGQGLDGNTVIYLAIMLLASLVVPVGAYLDYQSLQALGAAVLWIGVLTLFLGAAITLPGSTTAVVPSAVHTQTPDSVGIGIYFVPAVLMALVTAVVGMVIRHTPAQPMAMRPH